MINCELIIEFLKENPGFQHEDKIAEATGLTEKEVLAAVKTLDAKKKIETNNKNIHEQWRLKI